MSWTVRMLNSSIGRKQIMAVTGLAFCLFLTTHLIGNLFIYAGEDAFNSYVEHLHSLGPLIHIAEMGLAFFALLHVSNAIVLIIRNRLSRPTRYAKYKSTGGRTLASATMPYTGSLILIFLIFHLLTLKFADHTDKTVYDLLAQSLANPIYAGFYILFIVAVGFHVFHGVWSAFQTIGLNHPKYTPLIRVAGILFSLVITAGFASIPLTIVLK
ncbi:succinate dehydrogenase cytochrome b subunit [bacterium]|nr:succinate dehydrogenase cytochrome b subunit [bacterium]